MKLHITKVPLYEIELIFTRDEKYFTEQISKEESKKITAFCTWSTDDNCVGIYIPKKGCKNRLLGMLAHESFHAASIICDWAGVEPSDYGSEATAYLLQWIYEYCLGCIDKENKRKR